MAHRILNIPLISTTILALNTAYDHLLMYKLYLSSFGLLFDVNEFVPGLIQVVVWVSLVIDYDESSFWNPLRICKLMNT